MDYELEILSLKKRIEELERIVLKTAPTPSPEPQASNRDKTKYMFLGKVFPKNRLVLAIVKQYAEEHNSSFEELSEVFDKSLQGSLGVVELYDTAIKTTDAKKRYFLADADVLNLNGVKAVVCTQWGIFNIVKFVKRATDLGFNIETI